MGRDRVGAFASEESARDLIKCTLDNNAGAVQDVASGHVSGDFITWRFGFQTGREAYLPAPDSDMRDIPIRPTFGVGVAIAHDPHVDAGFRIITAYPRNENARLGQ